MEKNLQTAATSNSGHSKKTLLIALSIIAALLILAGAVLAVFIVIENHLIDFQLSL